MNKKKAQKTTKRNTGSQKGEVVSLSSNKNAKIAPLGSRVLIKPFSKEELERKNTFGIILPEKDNNEKSEQGLVLAVGPGEYRDGKLVPPNVKIGDKVAFSKYGYDEIKFGEEELYLIKEENILAILK